MAYRFNSGMGGITCDTCNTLVVTGKQLYPGKELIAVPTRDGDELHFCSKKCKHKYKGDYEQLGVKNERADRERRRREKRNSYEGD